MNTIAHSMMRFAACLMLGIPVFLVGCGPQGSEGMNDSGNMEARYQEMDPNMQQAHADNPQMHQQMHERRHHMDRRMERPDMAQPEMVETEVAEVVEAPVVAPVETMVQPTQVFQNPPQVVPEQDIVNPEVARARISNQTNVFKTDVYHPRNRFLPHRTDNVFNVHNIQDFRHLYQTTNIPTMRETFQTNESAAMTQSAVVLPDINQPMVEVAPAIPVAPVYNFCDYISPATGIYYNLCGFIAGAGYWGAPYSRWLF